MNEFESVNAVDWDVFRHDLAFVASDIISDEEINVTQEFLIKLCKCVPRFYGEELDRLKMWDRIASGLDIISSKITDSTEIVDLMLRHVCGDISTASADDGIGDVINESEKISPECIKRVIAKKKLYIIYKARSAWKSRYNQEGEYV